MGAKLTPLVNREEEIALLMGRWQQAKEGDGQVVLLFGRAWNRQVADHPGDLRDRIAGEPPWTRLLSVLSLLHQSRRSTPLSSSSNSRSASIARMLRRLSLSGLEATIAAANGDVKR